MQTATQFDLFGGERVADTSPRGRTTLSDHAERCNLCCIQFEQDAIPAVGSFFYLGFRICERCSNELDKAARDKSEGVKVTRWRDAEFFASKAGAKTIAVVIDGAIVGFIGDAPPDWIGKGVRYLPYTRMDDDDIAQQLMTLAVDRGIVTDKALMTTGYRFDHMVAEIYDNVNYGRLDPDKWVD